MILDSSGGRCSLAEGIADQNKIYFTSEDRSKDVRWHNYIIDFLMKNSKMLMDKQRRTFQR
jgi:hypothetical protein